MDNVTLDQKNWHTYIPTTLWSIMALCTLPGVVLSGFVLFDAFFMAVAGFDQIASRTIWNLHMMVSNAYMQHVGTFLAIIALLLGSAAVLNLAYDSSESKGSEGNKASKMSVGLIMTSVYMLPAAIIAILAMVLCFAFAVMMAFPLIFVAIAAPLNVIVLLVLLAIAVFIFVTAALPIHRF